MSITDPLPDAQAESELANGDATGPAGCDGAAGSGNNAGDGGHSGGRKALLLDLFSAYVLAACRVIAWGGITGILLLWYPPGYFALAALVRGTVGLLGYLAVGIGPALVHKLSQCMHNSLTVIPMSPAYQPEPAHGPGLQTIGSPDDQDEASHANPAVLEYRTPGEPDKLPLTPFEKYLSSGFIISLLGAIFGFLVAVKLAPNFASFLDLTTDTAWTYTGQQLPRLAASLVTSFSLGISLRMLSEPFSAVLQVRGKIAMDNFILAAGEGVWLCWCAISMSVAAANPGIRFLGFGFVASSAVVLLARLAAVSRTGKVQICLRADDRLFRSLFSFGSGVLLAQLADFLHGPTDQILIGRFLNATSIAIYNPALQIDGGLLLLVGGLAMILLPRSARAHARGDTATLRRYYLRGTAASLGLLILGAVAAMLIAPHVLGRWLHDQQIVAGTLAILPLILVHTVMGGSSAIGRSILLGMGKVKVFAMVALASGILNVVISAALVIYTNLGLKGIVLGTIITVFLRCVVWMPWYVMSCLKNPNLPGENQSGEPMPDEPMSIPPAL